MDGVGSTASPATSGAGVAGASGKSSGEEVLDKKRLQVTSFTVLTGFLQHSTLNYVSHDQFWPSNSIRSQFRHNSTA